MKPLKPNLKLLKEASNQIKEIVVTSISDGKEYDFLLLSFCTWIGIDEEPVTLSVHSVLGDFWKNKLNKRELVAYQASEHGGEIYLKPFENSI